MDESSLHQFYQYVLLPQFGFDKVGPYDWTKCESLGPDEAAHHFLRKGNRYILIYEDYGGLAVLENYVRDNLHLKTDEYEYIEPTSSTNRSPSYEFKLPVPCVHEHNVIGSFTLIRLNPVSP